MATECTTLRLDSDATVVRITPDTGTIVRVVEQQTSLVLDDCETAAQPGEVTYVVVSDGTPSVIVQPSNVTVVHTTAVPGPPGPAGPPGSGGEGLDLWIRLVMLWDVEPTHIHTIPEGDVWQYTLDSVTRYRLVPDPYTPSSDTFYGNLTGDVLSDPISSRT